ncbi:MAG: hypothetical protein MRY77_19940, partial [Rhodobacteraceae bacterium]|nr:hypothetical protein [Paracoccaceae bacterium]
MVVSLASPQVQNVNDAPNGTVELLGSNRVGESLELRFVGLQDPDGLGVLRYEWHRNGTPVPLADQGSYDLTTLDEGARLSARVTYVDGYGRTEELLTAPSDPITPAIPTITGTEASEGLNGTGAAEQINALGGSDWINPGGGSDTIDGGPGNDMVSFANLGMLPGQRNVDYRLDIDLGAGTGRSFDDSEQLMFTNVERITGTIYGDRIRGDDGDNQLRGLGHY